MITTRINFNKIGLASYFSQLDLQRVMARALKKSKLPVWYSLGFNPHIYMTFTLPLSLGHESICESFDFRLNENVLPEDIIKAMENTLPQGIEIISAGEPSYDAKNIYLAEYKITLFDNNEKIKAALHSYKDLPKAIVIKTTKKKGDQPIDLKELIQNITIIKESDDSVTFTALFPAGVISNINPNLLTEFLKSTYNIHILDAKILRVKLLNENLEIL